MTDNSRELLDELVISWLPPKRGRVTGTVVVSQNKTKYPFQINLLNVRDRENAIEGICKQWPAVDTEDSRNGILRQLEHLAAQQVEIEESQPQPQSSQADLLVELAHEAQLFHNSGDLDAEGFAIIMAGDHRENWPVKSKSFRRWLCKQFHAQNKKVPSSQAISDALNVIEGEALFGPTEYEVHVRIARFDCDIWLDLADSKWRAVQISPTGWQVIDHPPVRFIRPKGMQSLPDPARGGSIQELRRFINMCSDDDWYLTQAWLVAALQPEGPYPILAVSGEQGSGKSTTCRMLRNLIDPNAAPVRSLPRTEHDLIIAASNSSCLVFDNVSSIPTWLSDGFCRLSTGGGYSTRELYSNRDEVLFNEQRPFILNGIGDLGTRGDLLDRSIIVATSEILEEKRLEERDLWDAFRATHPKILGALLDAVVAGLRRSSEVQLDRKPRMADFARTVVAAEPALDIEPGAFLPAYFRNCGMAHETAIELTAVGPAILDFMQPRDTWEGTFTELLDALEGCVNEKTLKRKDWPKAPNSLSNILKRLAPNLRKVAGIRISYSRTSGQRLILIDKSRKKPLASSPLTDDESAAPPDSNTNDTDLESDRDDPVTIDDDRGDNPECDDRHSSDDRDDLVTIPSCRNPLPTKGHDDHDDDDDLFQRDSGDVREEIEI